ncbi:MAG: type IV pilus secretin PilQ [Neisseria sp.]|uniref:type IV pilus secretin PilQ n=1 Tax=Neisseria sp. TaxID=192066 RepID=UPI0026DAF257|nr:type IV pilus secretin PilQ [Neisseria sp.]MDO4249562.1 type IV pilus secretin PilQ [Neisseria sp.]
MKPITIKTLSAIGLGLAIQTAFAGNITDINVSTLPDNQKIIKIKFDRDVIAPTGFNAGSPSRIALDFPGTGVALGQSVLEYADPLLNQISAAEDKGKTRVLLNLSKAGQYKTEIKNQEVWVYVNEAAAPAAAVVSSSPVARAQQEQIGNTANIDFRKGSGNAGVVELNTGNFTGEPEIKRQNDRIVVTLKNYPIQIQSQRNLDVSDFNTPVRTITMKRLGNATQIVIKNNGNWDLRQQAANGRLTFEVTPKISQESAGLEKKSKNFSGKRVSFDFQDVEVRTILQILAKESGINIVASDSVNGKMTLTLKDVPWDQALDLVLDARNLDMRRTGNIINVAPRDELLAKDKATLQAQNEINDLGPLYSQTFQLKYKNVEEFRKILNLEDNNSSSNENSILSKRGSALMDPATNTLIITDTSMVIRKFQKLIEELDVPTRQVMVEARIVEATDSFARDLGVKFGYQGVNGSNSWGSDFANAVNNSGTAVSNAYSAYNNAVSGSNTLVTPTPFTFNPNVSLPVSSATSTLALVHSFASGALGLELSASQAQGKSKIISSPRILTQDRKEAVIESGKEIPYQEASSSGATSTSFKKAVLGLKVTPNITPDGQIIMDIQVNKDSVDASCGASEPCISTKNLKTMAMVEDGGTLILGGIYEEENSDTVNKVPFLGDIPVVGNLFKSRSRSDSRNELLIFITPRIMDHQGSNLRY